MCSCCESKTLKEALELLEEADDHLEWYYGELSQKIRKFLDKVEEAKDGHKNSN